MSEIETFLATVVPFTPGAYVNIHFPFKRPGAPVTEKPSMPGRAFTSHASAAGYVRFRHLHPVDLYVCMSSQAAYKQQVSPTKWKAARHALSAVELCDFWIDADLKGFDTTQAIIDEVTRWRLSIQFPEPTCIVLTGSGGAHFHWTLDTPVPATTWQPLADALVAAARANPAFQSLDLGLSANPACLLRIPGTFNQKHNPPRMAMLHGPVGAKYPLAVIEQALAPFKQATYGQPVRSSTSLPFKPSPVLAGMPKPPPLDDGLDTWRPTIDEVADQCPFIDETLATGGAGYSEPLWFESLKIAYYCQDAEDAAHDLSDGHATYSEAGTERKMAEIDFSHGGARFGWPQCQTIYNAGAIQCRTCPHLPKGKSPINFALPSAPPPAIGTNSAPIVQNSPIIVAVPAPPSWGPLPNGYRHNADGTVLKLADGDQQQVQLVSAYPIYNVEKQQAYDGRGHHGMTFTTRLDAGGEVIVHLRHGDMSNVRKFGDALSTQAMFSDEAGYRRIHKLMVSFAETLRERKQLAVASEIYGWSRGNAAFNYGGWRYNCAGNARVNLGDAFLEKTYKPVGDLAVWVDACKLITSQCRPELDIAVAAAFGAPLVDLLKQPGLILSLYGSKSGIGKTHSLRVGQSVWGHPRTGMFSVADTQYSMMERIGKTRNLPAYFDEVKPNDIPRLNEALFTFSQGKTKARLTASIEQREVYDISTILTTGSNSSIFAYMEEKNATTTAGVHRIFEVPVGPNTDGRGIIDAVQAQTLNGKLNDNYGMAGMKYAEFLGSNVDKAQKLVEHLNDTFHKTLQAEPDERFWVSTMAATMAGASLANSLQLTQINIEPMALKLIEVFKGLRRARHSSGVDITRAENVEVFLSDYINARRQQTIYTNTRPMGAGRPPMTTARPPVQDLRGAVVIRFVDPPDNVVLISTSDFKAWLAKERRVPPTEIIAAIRRILPTRIIKQFNLVAGVSTLEGGARGEVLELDLDKYNIKL